MKKAVILLSGGLDSTTCLAVAKSKKFSIYALSFRYGQRHDFEIGAAKEIARSSQVKDHVILDIDLRAFGGFSLLNLRIFSLVLMRWIIAGIQIAGLNTLHLLKKCQILQQKQGLKENQK